MKMPREIISCACVALCICGCTLYNESDRALSGVKNQLDKMFNAPVAAAGATDGTEAIIANPPAKTLVFDGREIVLGTADLNRMSTAQFRDRIISLLSRDKGFSAARLIRTNPGVAEQLLWESLSDVNSTVPVAFISNVLSSNAHANFSWASLLAKSKADSASAQSYFQTRTNFLLTLKSEEPNDALAEQLRSTAQHFNHPLVMCDALNLLAVRELSGQRYAWAESLFRQAIDIAEYHADLARASELWLMVTMTASRAQKMQEAESAWLASVNRRIDYHLSSVSAFDASFWIQADLQRVGQLAYPERTAQALLPYTQTLDCKLLPNSHPEQVLWSAVAISEYDSEEPQLALVHFKKAETFSQGDDIMWLRISQGKCLAALGQSEVASALLSGPAASKNAVIAAAATAAMGSAKMQAGAYHQGAQLLAKALHGSPMLDWNSRTKAEADLALAQLVLGDTDEGLSTLHNVQKKFRAQGDIVSLLQSLENELKILELEKRDESAAEVKLQIKQVEQT